MAGIYHGICLLYTSIFLLRQHFKSIPRALAEAAKIDGASTWQTIWRVYMPCAKPAYMSFAVISVSYHWNNYLWPLIVTNSPSNRTLTVGPVSYTHLRPGRVTGRGTAGGI